MIQTFPPSSMICKTFCLRVLGANSTGSCFAVPIDDAYCLVTARHVVDSLPEGKAAIFEFSQDGSWISFMATPYFCSGDIDIAILQSNIPNSGKGNELELDMGNMYLGQDVYFLGFPYFGGIEYPPQDVNSRFPVPLIKKAVASSISADILYLDGHNNPGFSGGPVIFYDYDLKRNKIAAVISAYICHGRSENSGIIVSYTINHAKKLILEKYGKEPNITY